MNITLRITNVNSKTQIGTINVYLDFYTSTQRRQIFIKTPVRVEKSYWNAKSQKISKSHPNFKQLNDLLANEFQVILNVINELDFKDLTITPEKILEFVNAKKEGIKDLITLAKEYKELRTDAKPKVIEKITNVISRLEDFQKGKRLYYSDINQKFVNNFNQYLKTENPDHKNKNFRKGQQPSTIQKTFGFLRQILNHYFQAGIINDSFKTLKYPRGFKQKQMVFTESEIKLILGYTPKIKRLEKVKDLCLLQLYTALRYSDSVKLNKSNIYNDSINLNTTKTNQDLIIPLHKNLKILLEKYNYDLTPLKISNVRYNEYLKELIKLTGITSKAEYIYFSNGKQVTTQKFKFELVSSHTNRRTFITNAILQGIPLHVIQSLTGHATLKQLSEYVNIADEIKKIEMNKLDNLFSIG